MLGRPVFFFIIIIIIIVVDGVSLLQIVDAFCTSRANLAGPKAVESVLAWALRLCRLGGVEHLVSSLKVCVRVCVFHLIFLLNGIYIATDRLKEGLGEYLTGGLL